MPLIIFDGGTGTSFQNLNLTAEDFGGKELEGCNENLVLSSPEVVEKVHNSFLEAGCHVIETNTFGASSNYIICSSKKTFSHKRCLEKIFDMKLNKKLLNQIL